MSCQLGRHRFTKIDVLQEEAETDALRSNGNGAMADRGEDNEGVGDAAGPEPHRVWVLCGGTGSGADASLASGIHVYHELLKHPDIVVRTPCRLKEAVTNISELDVLKSLGYELYKCLPCTVAIQEALL